MRLHDLAELEHRRGRAGRRRSAGCARPAPPATSVVSSRCTRALAQAEPAGQLGDADLLLAGQERLEQPGGVADRGQPAVASRAPSPAGCHWVRPPTAVEHRLADGVGVGVRPRSQRLAHALVVRRDRAGQQRLGVGEPGDRPRRPARRPAPPGRGPGSGSSRSRGPRPSARWPGRCRRASAWCADRPGARLGDHVVEHGADAERALDLVERRPVALLEQPEVGQHDRVVEAQRPGEAAVARPSSATSWPRSGPSSSAVASRCRLRAADRGDGDPAGGQQRHPAADAGRRRWRPGRRRRGGSPGRSRPRPRASPRVRASGCVGVRSVIWNTLPLHGTLAVPSVRESRSPGLDAGRPRMGVLRLAHVDVRTPDLELSTAYYTEVLGLQRHRAHRRRGLPQVLGRGGPPLAAAALPTRGSGWTSSPSASSARTTSTSSRSGWPTPAATYAGSARARRSGRASRSSSRSRQRPDHGAGLGPREGRQHPRQAQPVAGAAAGPARHRAAADGPHAHQRRGGRRVLRASSTRCSASG